MTLIKSISGIRGTIGGLPEVNLTPIDIVSCTAAYGQFVKSKNAGRTIVVGRDGRISGSMVSNLAMQTLVAMGFDVIDLGFSTTPTVEIMVQKFSAAGGIIFTASHNPKEWNALKFLNNEGEFISAADGEYILKLIADNTLEFVSVDDLGKISPYDSAIEDHIQSILQHKDVQRDLIAKANLTVVVDCINSTGALSVPPLLDALGVKYFLIHEDITGNFAHNPEPLPIHLKDLADAVVVHVADLGISVDPDVDRLAFVCEDGSMFGEEYTLVAIADYLLGRHGGNAVSNLSSTRALRDITLKHGGCYFASAVGEVNVVNAMKTHNATIGGEGNGGIIVPDFHYGRDALIGIALFLSHMAEKKVPVKSLRSELPHYEMVKDKIDAQNVDINASFQKLKETFAQESINEVDGLKIDFNEGWVHMRLSNTEPIIRIYAEAPDQSTAHNLIKRIKSVI